MTDEEKRGEILKEMFHFSKVIDVIVGFFYW